MIAITGCDSCVMLAGLCPGEDEHCERGEHCVSCWGDCASTVTCCEHPPRCCACNELLPVDRPAATQPKGTTK